MSDRGILFSGVMVRALLADRKGVTRRLPGLTYEVGQRLYVRELWKTLRSYDAVPPNELSDRAPAFYCADQTMRQPANAVTLSPIWGRQRQGMHMMRWMSRIWLEVTGFRQEPLHAITPEDAIAEGLLPVDDDGTIRGYSPFENPRILFEDPRCAYRMLWDELHGTESNYGWRTNPIVDVISFAVHRGNIDAGGE